MSSVDLLSVMWNIGENIFSSCPCNVPKPIFSLETLTVHCLLLFGCVFAGLLMKLRIRVYMFDYQSM
jgi:hypothetical protein